MKQLVHTPTIKPFAQVMRERIEHSQITVRAPQRKVNPAESLRNRRRQLQRMNGK